MEQLDFEKYRDNVYPFFALKSPQTIHSVLVTNHG